MKFLILCTFLSLALIVAAHPGLPPPNLIKRETAEKSAELLKFGGEGIYWDDRKLGSKSGAERDGHDRGKEKNEKALDEEGKAAKKETWENVRPDNGARQHYVVRQNYGTRQENGEDLLGKASKKENEEKVVRQDDDDDDDDDGDEDLKKLNLEEREKKESKKFVRGTDEEEFLGMKKKRNLEKFALEPVEGRFGVYKTDSGHLVRLIEANGDPAARYVFDHFEERALGSSLPPGSGQRQAGYRTSGLSRTSLAKDFGDRARFWPFTSWYDDYSYGGYGGYYPYNDYYYYDYYHYKK